MTIKRFIEAIENLTEAIKTLCDLLALIFKIKIDWDD